MERKKIDPYNPEVVKAEVERIVGLGRQVLDLLQKNPGSVTFADVEAVRLGAAKLQPIIDKEQVRLDRAAREEDDRRNALDYLEDSLINLADYFDLPKVRKTVKRG